MSHPERIPDKVALPLAEAMASHQGLTKAQRSECAAQLLRLARVANAHEPTGESDDQGRPLTRKIARVVEYRVPRELHTKNERLLLPLLLDYHARDWQHDPAKRKLADHPSVVAERHAAEERARAEDAKNAAENAASARVDASIDAKIDAAVAPLHAAIDKLAACVNLALDRIASPPSQIAPNSQPPLAGT